MGYRKYTMGWRGQFTITICGEFECDHMNSNAIIRAIIWSDKTFEFGQDNKFHYGKFVGAFAERENECEASHF